MKINVPGLILFFSFATAILLSCQKAADLPAVKGTYAYDAGFLKKHTGAVIELQDGDAKVLLSSDYQGRVMTSSAKGEGGNSYGWINYDLIGAKEKKKQFNPVGGEERFWLGPEGGQFSLYFKQGDPFTIEHWQVPAFIDTLSFQVEQHDAHQATFSRQEKLTNYSGTEFTIRASRTIRLLASNVIEEKINTRIPASVAMVGYETVSTVTNEGANDWTKEKGLISVWLLAMMTPSDQTIVIIPFHPGPDARKFITDNYFGPVPTERLLVNDSVLYFTCDGKYRSKIGLSPSIAKPIAASYDFLKNVLTLILFPVEKDGAYVNSKWEIQEQPFSGDVVNSYNDGPLADGTQLGPFYEIESSSSAAALKKGEKMEYKQTTLHFEGGYEEMRALAQTVLGVDLNVVRERTSKSNE